MIMKKWIKAYRNELPLPEMNQNRTGSDPKPEQIGRIALVRATQCEVHR